MTFTFLFGFSCKYSSCPGRSIGQMHRRLVPLGEDAVESTRWHKDKISILYFNQLISASFNNPVNFTFEHHPPLVTIVTMAIANLPRILADQRTRHMIRDDQRVSLGWRSHFFLNLFKTNAVKRCAENRILQCHRSPP